ncbi:MAG: methyltransferase domain-containing protein [bacterium]|nr:methyltransferase domain-containing protein [bacterium]
MDRSSEIKQALLGAYKLLEPWSKPHLHERNYYEKVMRYAVGCCPDRDGYIADLGSGVGVLPLALRLMGYKVDGFEKYVFSDAESPMFKVADVTSLKEVWNKNGLEVFDCDVLAVPGENLKNKYNVVINTALIEHVKNPKLLLGNMRLLLKDGGHIITMTPNLAVFYKRLRFLLGLSPHWNVADFFNLGELGFTGHWREYTSKELCWVHKQAGFEIIKANNCDIFPLTDKKNLRNFIHLFARYISYPIANSREANIVIGKKNG